MGKLAIETRGVKKSFGKTHAVASSARCSGAETNLSNGDVR